LLAVVVVELLHKLEVRAVAVAEVAAEALAEVLELFQVMDLLAVPELQAQQTLAAAEVDQVYSNQT
jgi:hypothetical protein